MLIVLVGAFFFPSSLPSPRLGNGALRSLGSTKFLVFQCTNSNVAPAFKSQLCPFSLHHCSPGLP